LKQETKLININELARLWGVKESWIRSQIFKKSIPYYKVQGLIRFNTSEVNSWIEGLHVPTYDVNDDLEVSND
jgi:excisionase family DNA binding protein